MRTAPALLMTAVAILLSGGGCYYDSEEDLYPGAFCDTANITYTNRIEPLILSNCAQPACHVPGGDGAGDFTHYSGVKAKVDNGTFRNQTIVNKVMPPGAPLSKCELQLLQAWLDRGAANN